MKLEESTALAALLNTLVAIFFRILTFALNAFILRRISGEVLGLINVRLLLLFDTIIFISREAFRKSCLKKPKEWRGTINLIWLSLPIGLISASILSYLWIHHLEKPSDPFYVKAVILMSLSALIEICHEPFFVVGQIFQWVKFRSLVDMLSLIIRSVLLTLAVIYDPSRTVLHFANAHLLSTLIQLLAYYLKIRKSYQDLAPIQTLSDLMPDFSHIDKEKWTIAKSFLRQGLLKQLLTEGEKYLFTWFSLMTLSQQGIYDVISNLGSLLPRLVFSKIEEQAYFYFNVSVQRGKIPVENRVSQNLYLLLRLMTLLGLIVLTFGLSYSHLLLAIIYGKAIFVSLGSTLLKGHCVFVFLMAVNGISECFSFAVMTSQQVDSYNYLMTFMAVLFLFLAWFLSRLFGPLGFIFANWANFLMRIAHNYKIIKETSESSLDCFNLNFSMISTFVLSGALCQLSERFIYNADVLICYANFVHLFIGLICFLLTLFVMKQNEPEIVSFAVKRFKKE